MARTFKNLIRCSGKVLLAASLLIPVLAMADDPTPKPAGVKDAPIKFTEGIKQEKIGIYDLKAIHAIPLDAETISKTEVDGVTFEKVRFSSVDNIRIFAILSYRKGASKLPGMLVVDRFKAVPKKVEATNNYFAMSIAAPNGNKDPNRDESVGGPRFDQPFTIDDQFRDNPSQSYIYQHTVGLLRALDYLETRPEVDVSKTVVSGYSWPGLMVATLHGLDDRPCAYILFHGLGYYADAQGKSGGQSALFSRASYDMYGAGTYAPLGKKPIYVGTALDDFFTKMDSIMEVYNNLKCEKVFAYAPNRTHAVTSRDEFNGQYPWQTYWQMGKAKPTTIGEGKVTAAGGKLTYTCSVEERQPLKYSEIFVSYGQPGNWMGRTWHTYPMTKSGDSYTAEIPVYDPAMPFYVVAQVGTGESGTPGTDEHMNGSTVGNGVQFIDPATLGITKSTADIPHVLFNPSLKSDLYLRTGIVSWPPDATDSKDGKGSVIVRPNEKEHETTVLFQNIEPNLWKGGTEIHILLKGDGKPGPLTAYLMYDANYFLDKDVKNYTAIPLVPSGTMQAGWNDYTIDLKSVTNLDRVGSLFFEPGDHVLQIGTITWK